MQPTQQYHGSPNWTQWWLLVTLSFHVLSPQHHIAPPPIKVLWIILGMHVTESVQALRINSSLLNYPRRGFVAPKRLLLKNTSIFTFLVCFEKLRVIHGNWAKIKGSTTAKGMHFKPRKYPHSIPPPQTNDPQGSIWPLAVTNFHEDSASHDQLCQTNASTQEIRQPWAALLYMQAGF